MASIEDHHHVYNDDDDVDVDVEDDEDSSSSPSLAGEVTIAVAGVGVSSSDSPSLHPDPKRQRVGEFTPPVVMPEKKPPAVFDDSRKLFQRLWTDEDEIELLQGFLDYTTQRGVSNPSQQHHYDTTAFYDQIKSKFQLDFNKNQLVEKLRRLKKKYRTVMSKMGSGKEFVFKSAHDRATFEISRKIWCNGVSAVRAVAGGPVNFSGHLEDGGLDDEDAQHVSSNRDVVIYHSPNFNLNSNPNGIDIKTPRPRKQAFKVEQHSHQPSVDVPMPTQQHPIQIPIQMAALPVAAAPAPAPATPTVNMSSIPSLIEETMRSCVSPIFKELLNNVSNLNGASRGGLGLGGMGLSPIPLGFGGGVMSMEMMGDEKWRKQQMLELEVYSKRLELIQDQIKAQLEELRSMGS